EELHHQPARDLHVLRERWRPEDEHVVARGEGPLVLAGPEVLAAALVGRPPQADAVLRRQVAAEGRDRTPRVEEVVRRRRVPGLVRRQRSPRPQVVGRRPPGGERPFLPLAPAPADEDTALRRPVAVAAAHHEDPDRRLAVDAVVDPLQPPIEPAPWNAAMSMA